jgi:hypothetical protein
MTSGLFGLSIVHKLVIWNPGDFLMGPGQLVPLAGDN